MELIFADAQRFQIQESKKASEKMIRESAKKRTMHFFQRAILAAKLFLPLLSLARTRPVGETDSCKIHR